MALSAMIAVREMIKADPTIIALLAESTGENIPPAEDRVFVNEIPEEVIANADTFHPPKMIVLHMDGGAGKFDTTVLDSPLVTVLCYGESFHECERVRLALWSKMVKLEREKFSDVLIHDANPTGGPIPLRDPDIVWPAVSQSFSITADVEEAV